jgi:CRISPR-associated protein Cmr2
MSYILAFHIGPVQEFIFTARRTQDWWMGSWLLSHLVRTAIDALPNKESSLILPKVRQREDDQDAANVPNHFFARVPSDGIAKAAEMALKKEWQRIADEVKEVLFREVSDELWPPQVEGLLEIYWALVPDEGEGSRNKA